MIDPDSLKCGEIETKLKSKQFVLVKNVKGNSERWLNDISLIGRINENGAEEILEGFAAWWVYHFLNLYRISRQYCTLLLAIIAIQPIELTVQKINMVKEETMA